MNKHLHFVTSVETKYLQQEKKSNTSQHNTIHVRVDGSGMNGMQEGCDAGEEGGNTGLLVFSISF